LSTCSAQLVRFPTAGPSAAWCARIQPASFKAAAEQMIELDNVLEAEHVAVADDEHDRLLGS